MGRAEIEAATAPASAELDAIEAQRRLELESPAPGELDAGGAERLLKVYAGEAARQHRLAGRAVRAGRQGIAAARAVAGAAGKPQRR